MTFILGAPKFQAFQNGSYLVGGKVYVYAAGTTTPIDSYPTWDDAVAETNPNANPVILDSRGEADIVLNGASKITLTDADDNELWTVDELDRTTADIVTFSNEEILTFTKASNAVNNLEITNASAGNAPSIAAVGSDTNIGIEFSCQGDGSVIVQESDLELTSGSLELTSGDIQVTSGDLTGDELILLDGEVLIQDNNSGFSLVAAGTTTWYAGSTAPSGWLECDGSAISRTTYPVLFSAIGTNYGAGDGSTTFNLPNQARHTLVGRGGTGTSDLGNTLGDVGGEEAHALTEDEIPSHIHIYEQCRDSFTHHIEGPEPHNYSTTLDSSRFTESAGDSTPYNIMQPSLILSLLIRAY